MLSKKLRATFTRGRGSRYTLTSLTNAVLYRYRADPEGPGASVTYKSARVGDILSANEIASATDGVEYTIKDSPQR